MNAEEICFGLACQDYNLRLEMDVDFKWLGASSAEGVKDMWWFCCLMFGCPFPRHFPDGYTLGLHNGVSLILIMSRGQVGGLLSWSTPAGDDLHVFGTDPGLGCKVS